MLFNKKSIKVKLVGTDLVAAFDSAEPALVWKFDLARNHSFTVALQGEEGDWELGVTSPKGDFYPVAHFLAREDAEEALHKIHKVLVKKQRSKYVGCLTLFVGFIVLLLILIFVGGSLIQRVLLPISQTMSLPDMGESFSSVSPFTNAPSSAPPEIPNGVPLSADDVLKPPPH
jgi:hypothetical protein